MKHIDVVSRVKAANLGLEPCRFLGPAYCDLIDSVRRAWSDFLIAKKNEQPVG